MIKKFFKEKKIDILCNILFILTYLLIIVITCRFGKFILGSTTDFDVQHYLIPDYFRTLFYKTHDILPDFAFNLGAGQNIYYLSYYGLFNPIILLSYLFPNVSMLNYIMVAMGVVVVSSVSLFYFYLRKNGYSYLVSFLSSFMLLCASPFIFHSHRHIMFIDYMPFLIMGFYGIDRFLSKKKSGLLILSIVLMIFTSYYYSISGMLVLFILGIYKYIRNNQFKFKEFLKFGFKLALRFIVGVLISAVLILPTLYTLFNGRSDSSSYINILTLLKPNMYLLYGHYSMGLTLISLVGIVYAIFKGDKSNKLLGIILLVVSICPLIVYILNGFLYVNAKVLIPFIPLVLLLTSEFMIKVLNKKWSKFVLVVYVVSTSLVVCLSSNLSDKLISKEAINRDLNANYASCIEEIIAKDDVYRINTSNIDKPYINKVFDSREYKTTMYSSAFNSNYKELYSETFQNPLPYRNKFMITASDNLLFQMYMGEKYIFTPVKYNSIYEEVSKKGTINVYKNNYVLPIAYATNKAISKDEFKNLRYPDSIINMLGKVVVDGKSNVDTLKTSDILLDYDIISSEGVKSLKNKDGYKITVDDYGKVKIKVKNDLKDKLLFIGFDLESKNADLAITINGITNKLTNKNWKYYNENTNFNYTLIGDEVMEISFTKGVYDISNVLVSTIDFDEIKDVNRGVDPFIIDKDETKGDQIKGKIEVTRDKAYFTTSIPYDKGFTIFVDGKETDYFKINGGFIGFNISRGIHEVTIDFKAPYKDVGIVISLIGVIFSLIIIFLERRR